MFNESFDFLICEDFVVFSGFKFFRIHHERRIERDGSDAELVGAMLKRRLPAIRGLSHVGMVKDVILVVQYRPFSADEQQCILVVQHPNLIRHH